MGNPKRIPVDAIQAMKKILDALPEKNLGKTQEEALAMLNSQILKAYSKGYSVKELAGIMTKGNVAVSAPTRGKEPRFLRSGGLSHQPGAARSAYGHGHLEP